MCEEKPYRVDCRRSFCSKSNAYIVPSDRTPEQVEQAQRAEQERQA